MFAFLSGLFRQSAVAACVGFSRPPAPIQLVTASWVCSPKSDFSRNHRATSHPNALAGATSSLKVGKVVGGPLRRHG